MESLVVCTPNVSSMCLVGIWVLVPSETRGDLLLCLGVARVHLIYRTLRNAEGTTPKLNHYPSEAPALRQALRPRIASRDAPALRPYELRRIPTMLRRFPTMLRCFSTMLRRIFTMLQRTEGLDRFRGLPLYTRFGRSDRTQKRHGTTPYVVYIQTWK